VIKRREMDVKNLHNKLPVEISVHINPGNITVTLQEIKIDSYKYLAQTVQHRRTKYVACNLMA
jgi:hypothetical protein